MDTWGSNCPCLAPPSLEDLSVLLHSKRPRDVHGSQRVMVCLACACKCPCKCMVETIQGQWSFLQASTRVCFITHNTSYLLWALYSDTWNRSLDPSLSCSVCTLEMLSPSLLTNWILKLRGVEGVWRW